MASIATEPNGRRRILFSAADGKRKTLRLGKVTQRAAEAVKVHVEALAAASITGHAVADETNRWVARLDTKMAGKLAAVGLIPKRDAATLGAFLQALIEARSDVKGSTAITYENVRRNLCAFFGESKPLRDITAGDADSWRLWLVTHENLADNTVRRRTGIARQFFTVAARRRLIGSNPFDGLPASVRPNPSKFHYVSRADAERIIKACPDAQWRLIFALSRFGGLRCPSEHLALTWQDIDWARNRITVRSPKTEHHPGQDRRVIPLFPELLPHLRQAFEEAEPGTERVIPRYRDSEQNLRTQLERIITRAGVKPWPKLFHNLRSTRETELAETWPLHVVCAWIGNSQPVAAKHYLQTTDEHFDKAAGVQPEHAKAAQKAAQQTAHGAAPSGIPEHRRRGNRREMQSIPQDGLGCDNVQVREMGVAGLEPATLRV